MPKKSITAQEIVALLRRSHRAIREAPKYGHCEGEDELGRNVRLNQEIEEAVHAITNAQYVRIG